MRRTPMVETLARLLCKSGGNDPDALVLPKDYVIPRTSRGDLILGDFIDCLVPCWVMYGEEARAMVNAGWTKADKADEGH